MAPPSIFAECVPSSGAITESETPSRLAAGGRWRGRFCFPLRQKSPTVGALNSSGLVYESHSNRSSQRFYHKCHRILASGAFLWWCPETAQHRLSLPWHFCFSSLGKPFHSFWLFFLADLGKMTSPHGLVKTKRCERRLFQFN